MQECPCVHQRTEPLPRIIPSKRPKGRTIKRSYKSHHLVNESHPLINTTNAVNSQLDNWRAGGGGAPTWVVTRLVSTSSRSHITSSLAPTSSLGSKLRSASTSAACLASEMASAAESWGNTAFPQPQPRKYRLDQVDAPGARLVMCATHLTPPYATPKTVVLRRLF